MNECLSKNSGHKDGSHSNETISSESLDHQQLVQGFTNRSCGKKSVHSVSDAYKFVYVHSVSNNCDNDSLHTIYAMTSQVGHDIRYQIRPSWYTARPYKHTCKLPISTYKHTHRLTTAAIDTAIGHTYTFVCSMQVVVYYILNTYLVHSQCPSTRAQSALGSQSPPISRSQHFLISGRGGC